jgi:TRAP-type uncharacterized transport system fused permease subunit
MLAVHLFILYYAITSNLTPPVAVTAFVAASIAEAPAFKTGFLSMRLGVIMYLMPFFFVLRPELVLQTPLIQSVVPFLTSVVGIYLLAGALEGYLAGLEQPVAGILRIPVLLAGLLMFIPEWKTDVVGACIAAPIVLLMIRRRKALFQGSPH